MEAAALSAAEEIFVPDNPIVARDFVGGYEVSTVFLSLHAEIGYDWCYETMVFGYAGDEFDTQYASLAEADAGHAAAVAALRKAAV